MEIRQILGLDPQKTQIMNQESTHHFFRNLYEAEISTLVSYGI